MLIINYILLRILPPSTYNQFHMKIISILIILFTIQNSAFSQRLGILSVSSVGGTGDEYNTLPYTIPTNDGGFIIPLWSSSMSGPINYSCVADTFYGESLFEKYDATGTVIQWQKCYQRSLNQRIDYLFPIKNGWVLAGYSAATLYPNFITKHSVNDAVIWQKSYGQQAEILRDMKRTADSGFVMVMEVFGKKGDVDTAYGGGDIFVIKLDSNGNKQWTKVIGGTQEDDPTLIIPTPDGGMFITAMTMSNDIDCTSTDNAWKGGGYVVRLDKNGNIKWHLNMGATDGVVPFVYGCNNGKGGVVIAAGVDTGGGQVHHPIITTNYQGNMWVLNIDSTGHILWENCFGSRYGTYTNSVCLGKDGNVYVAGIADGRADGDVDISYGGNEAGWVIKVAINAGMLLGERVLGASNNAYCYTITPLLNGNIVATGTYGGGKGDLPNSLSGRSDVFVAILSPWTETVPSTSSKQSNMVVYPNPATNKFIVKISGQVSGKIFVTDLLGRLVLEMDVTQNETEMDARHLPQGTYFIAYKGKTGDLFINKIILQ
jgi:hypothetical protein